MNKLLQAVLLISLVVTGMVLPIRQAEASHYAGSDVTLTYTGTPGFYLLRVQVYRNCTGIAFPNPMVGTVNSSTYVQGLSSCGSVTDPISLNAMSIASEAELCPGQPNSCSTPANNAIPGIQLLIYEKIVQLAPCNDWVFTFSGNARNSGIVNITNSGSVNWYTDSGINTTTGIINSNPRFSSSPVPYACRNNIVEYNPQVTDPDGDSLVYSLVNARGNGGIVVPYVAGYSGVQPFGSATSVPMNPNPTTINPQTGQITFYPMVLSTATVSGYVVVMRIEEWRTINGVPTRVGFVHRDVQVAVLECTTPPPVLGDLDIIKNNTVIATMPNTSVPVVEACTPICIEFPASSLGVILGNPVNLRMTSNASNEIPNSVFTVIANNTPNPVGRVCFAPNPALAGQTFSFTVQVQDNACPLPNKIIRAISVQVNKETGYTVTSNVTSICAGDSVQITVNPRTGTVPLTSPSYTSQVWSARNPVNNQPLLGQFMGGTNSSTQLNPMVMPTQTTRYILTRNTAAGCVDTASVVINVTGITPTIQAINTPNTTLCMGQSSMLTANVTGPPNIFNPTWNYSWAPANGLTSTTIGNPIVSYAGQDSVTYTLFVNNGTCSDTETITIKFVPDAVVTSSVSPTSICLGQTVDLTATSNSAGSTFLWIDGDRIDDPTSPTTTAMPASTGMNTYQILVTTGQGCSKIDSVQINVTGVLPDLQPLVAASNTLCPGDVVEITSIVNYDQVVTTPPNFTYQWTPSTNLSDPNIANPIVSYSAASSSITYTLTVSDGASCVDTATMTFSFVPEIFIATTATPNSVCVGDSVDLVSLLTPSGISGVNFTWNGRGVNAINAGTTFAIPDTTGTLEYTVVAGVGNNPGCSKTETVTVNVSGVRPVITTLSANPAAICFGETSELSAAVASSVASINPTFSYEWSPASEIEGGATGSTGLTAVAQPGQTTTYTFSASDNGSCEVLGTIEVLVGAEVMPGMNLVYSADSLSRPPMDITFNSTTVTTGPIDSIHWVINNLDIPSLAPVHLTGTNPTLEFTNPNQYSVTMTAYTPYGCSYTITRLFRVGGLQVPNIITPNGDGVNDVFSVPALKAGGTVQIFNRWGKRLKEFGPGGFWAPGNDIPSGVYYYVVEDTQPNATYKGWLEIVR